MYLTISRVGLLLVFLLGVACGTGGYALLRTVYPADPPVPYWFTKRDVALQALIDNLESNNDAVRFYAVWRLGEMRGNARSALDALAKALDRERDPEGSGKSYGDAEDKIRGSVWGW